MKSSKGLFVMMCMFSSYIFAGWESIIPLLKNEENYKQLADDWYNKYFKQLDEGSKHLITEYIFYKYIQTSGSDIHIRDNNKYLAAGLRKYINNNWKKNSTTWIAFNKLNEFNNKPKILAYIYDDLVLKDIQFPYYTFIMPQFLEEQIYFSKKMQKLFE